MAAQLDLFAAPAPAAPSRPAAPAPAPVLADIIPRAPSVAWERLLRQHPDIATTVIVTCGDLCQGQIIETLLLGPDRNYWLTHDHQILEKRGNNQPPGRHIFLKVRQGIALHARHPLIRVKNGTHAGFYRLAAPGEAAPAELEVPPATIGPEIA